MHDYWITEASLTLCTAQSRKVFQTNFAHLNEMLKVPHFALFSCIKMVLKCVKDVSASRTCQN